jgi:fructose-bisphosphate aldolase class 1
MNAQELIDTASALVAGDKGLLAMDESTPTCNERFADGDHTLERCREVTDEDPRTVFSQLYEQREVLEGLILKTNTVLPELACPTQEPALEIWHGDEAQVSAAQHVLYHRAWCDRAARRGEYQAEMEKHEH